MQSHMSRHARTCLERQCSGCARFALFGSSSSSSRICTIRARRSLRRIRGTRRARRANTRILRNINQLTPIINRSTWISRTRSRRRHRVDQPERYSSRITDFETSNESLLVCAFELTLEETVEFGVLRSLLAVRNCLGVGLRSDKNEHESEGGRKSKVRNLYVLCCEVAERRFEPA